MRTSLLACALVLALAACNAGVHSGSTASAGSGGSSTSGLATSSSFATGTGTGGASCALYQHTEVHKPLNLYIMIDKSSSMAGAKWMAAGTGLTAFAQNPGIDNIQAALRFFPRPVDATPACDQPSYMSPTVPFGPLPMNAPALEAGFAAEMADGFSSPMYPALGGAILEGIQVAQNNPDQVSAVLLVTDGAPDGPGTSCAGVDPNDPMVIASLAAAGLTKGVPTFVIGMPGVDLTSMTPIAVAGGTGSVIVLDTTNTALEFQQALQKVSGQAIPCTYDIPAEVVSGMVELSKVNVETTPPMGMPQTAKYNQGCGGDGTGWQYDNPTMPTAIDICPSTCSAIKSSNGATIEVVLGCATVTM